MKIAVTGASGFLGSRIADRLQAEGHEVLRLTHAAADIADIVALRKALTGFGTQAVVHSAAIADIGECEKNRDKAERVNITGTRNVARVTAEADAALVFVSSDQVYDYRSGKILDESVEPSPLNYYGYTKTEGEKETAKLFRHYIARIAWQYDYRNGGSGLWGLAERAVRGQAVLKYAVNGRRSVNYVEDTVDVIAAMVKETLPYGVYNVASPNDMTEEETYRLALYKAGADESTIKRALIEKSSEPFDLRAVPANLMRAGYVMPDVAEGLTRCASDKANGR